MKKYLQVLKNSWQEIFIYRINFLLWRFRGVVQLLVVYFLWSTIFANQTQLFGYTKESILTYILGTSVIRSLVLSSRSVDVAGEIHQGALANFLLRPISYFGYWLFRDISDKLLNLVLSAFEITIIVWLLKPPLFIQTNILILLLTLVITTLSLLLYFYFSFLLSLIAFWVREVWAPRFLSNVLIEFLAGALFPLDILPIPVFSILKLLPFTYLLFFPLKVYLGQIQSIEVMQGTFLLLFWISFFYVAVKFVWSRGLRVYAAEGR